MTKILPVSRFEVGKSYTTVGGWRADILRDDKHSLPFFVKHHGGSNGRYWHNLDGSVNHVVDAKLHALVSVWTTVAPALSTTYTLEVGKHYYTQAGSIVLVEKDRGTDVGPDHRFNTIGHCSDDYPFHIFSQTAAANGAISPDFANNLLFPAIEDWGTTFNRTNLIDATKISAEPAKPLTSLTINDKTFHVGKFYKGNNGERNWIWECVNNNNRIQFILRWAKAPGEKWENSGKLNLPQDFFKIAFPPSPRPVLVEHNQTIVYYSPERDYLNSVLPTDTST